MTVRLVAVVLVLATFLDPASRAVADTVRWRDNDALPIIEPAEDPDADSVWWDGVWAMSYYQARSFLDLGVSLHAIGRWLRVLDPREAVNVNALDEALDSTWYTNRHARRRLSPDELARGANQHAAPAEAGPLLVFSGKAAGMTNGFVVGDAKGDRYVLKFDTPGYPEVPTGAEMVCSKIVHALGWNVPEYYLVLLDPSRFDIAEGARMRNTYEQKEPLTEEWLQRLLRAAGRRPDGLMRAVASRMISGVRKGGFRTLGRRHDDPNDTVPHEDRRELRGLRIVAAWINFTDARRGNFFDSFVSDPGGAQGRGHLVHYLLDLSSALGSGNDDWKPAWYGHEYYFDPEKALFRLATLGLVKPAWKSVPLAHRAIGYLDAESFDPEEWRTTYPNPLFDHATIRDSFWGAKLVASFREDDLRLVVSSGEWSDPAAADVLFGILRDRQRRIARAYFDARRINPIDDLAITPADATLRFHDLAVDAGVAAPGATLYRFRSPGGAWVQSAEPAVPLGETMAAAGGTLELGTSRDHGASWSPPARIRLERDESGLPEVTAIERETR